MSESKEYYKAIAEAREFQIDTILKPSVDLLSVSGVVMSMIADVSLYGSKNGKNEKYNQSMERLNILGDFISSCNSVNDNNYRLRYMLRSSIFERDKLKNENDKLKSELEAIKKAFNEE